MKKIIIIIGTLIVLVGGVVAILVVTQPQALTVSPVETILDQTTGTRCYAYHQVATQDAPYAVDEYLTFTINGTQVTGNKKGSQSGPDMTNGYSGNLTGTIAGDTITADYAYTVEGSKNIEQEIYKFTKTGIDKLQYSLIDNYKDGLVPDTTKEYKVRSYVATECVKPIAMCYSYEKKTPAGFFDRAILNMTILGNTISGEYKNLPAEKDSKTGTFEGVVGPMNPKISSRTADVWWNVMAEGMQATEQLKIQFGEGSAVAFFGEMKDSEDGSYVYAHPEKLTPGFQMNQKDCAEIK
ncbi:MAG: hypothetical protein WCG20_01360 [bacterium]